MRIVVLALAASPLLAAHVQAQKPFLPLAPVLTNKAFCAPDQHPITHVSDSPIGCCTKSGHCAGDLPTSTLEKPALVARL
jgi:hypothetical protein